MLDCVKRVCAPERVRTLAPLDDLVWFDCVAFNLWPMRIRAVLACCSHIPSFLERAKWAGPRVVGCVVADQSLVAVCSLFGASESLLVRIYLMLV